MPIITEQMLREYFRKNASSKEYSIGKTDKFTPSALDYINANKINIVILDSSVGNTKDMESHKYGKPVKGNEWSTPKEYKILYTGEVVDKKPETMTHLYENVLVYKDEPRIVLRGKLDSLQAKIIETQAAFAFDKSKKKLVDDLGEILQYSRQILGCEVLNKALPDNVTLLGFDEKQIREISHNPMKYFNMKQMVLLEHTDGIIVAKLNLLRTLVREAEIESVKAFRKGDSFERSDIVMALNRLSSIFHILIYKEISEQENNK